MHSKSLKCLGSVIYYVCISSKVDVSLGKTWISPTANFSYNPPPHCNLTRWPRQPPPIQPPPLPPPYGSSYLEVTCHQRGLKSNRHTHSRLRHCQTLSAPDDSWGKDFFPILFLGAKSAPGQNPPNTLSGVPVLCLDAYVIFYRFPQFHVCFHFFSQFLPISILSTAIIGACSVRFSTKKMGQNTPRGPRRSDHRIYSPGGTTQKPIQCENASTEIPNFEWRGKGLKPLAAARLLYCDSFI